MPLVLALQQRSPRQCVPLGAGGCCGHRHSLGVREVLLAIPQSGRAAQRTPNLSLWVLSKWVPVALGCHPSGGWRYPL